LGVLMRGNEALMVQVIAGGLLRHAVVALAREREVDP